MIRNEISVVLAGICGYGRNYIPHLLRLALEGEIRFVGAIEPNPAGCTFLGALQDAGVHIFPSLEEFYSKAFADLVILATPINLHCPQSCIALSKGSGVLCEKPIAATIQDAEALVNASAESKKFLAVGYQWSFTDAIQDLKRDIMSGLFGRPQRLKSLVLWPRDNRYYKRNNWAGRIRDDDGHWILDSPVNNAAAHYLHNSFYVLGDKIDKSTRPESVTAELYRANDIENFDTAALRCHTDSGIEILFYTSHAISQYKGPTICYEFENAVIRYETDGYGEDNPAFIAHFKNGRVKNYGAPDTQPFKKLFDTFEAAKSNGPIVCGAKAALPQTLCINGAQESAEIINFPSDLVSTQSVAEGNVRCVERLADILLQCYEKAVLPAELGVPWAVKGTPVDLSHYHKYPK